MDHKIILYTPYYQPASDDRRQEIDRCLRFNVECNAIDRIVLLIDDESEPPVRSDKLEVIRLSCRPTYRDWLEAAARKPEHHSVLSNSDIYFTNSLDRLTEYLTSELSFVALSRWDEIGNDLVPHPNPKWSQDTWAIKSTGYLPRNLLSSAEIPLGVPRCDNKIAYVFATQGFDIYNPFEVIKSVHVHESQERGYEKKNDVRIVGGVAYVNPTDTPQTQSEIEFDIWSLSRSPVKKASVNPSFRSWHGERGLRDIVAASLKPVAGSFAKKEDMYSELPDQALIYSFVDRFQVWAVQGQIEVVDNLLNTRERLRRSSTNTFQAPGKLDPEILYRFFPVWEDVPQYWPLDRATNGQPVYFWQYPCLTEKQAYLNSIAADGRTVRFGSDGVVRLYLPVPWATMIDKKVDIPRVMRVMALSLAGFRALVRQQGYRFEVHTVCQHIRWRRIAENVRGIGVTHLHVSHMEETDEEVYKKRGLAIHPWHLYAVNVEDNARRESLVPGKGIDERTYLASFIGAYREDYRSSSRWRIWKEAANESASAVLVEVNDDWHFEEVVYGEQVSGRTLSEGEAQSAQDRTARYNRVLSESVFSLCPDGTGPNTLRLWESLAVGAIPVVVSDGWVPPTVPGSEVQLSDVCYFLGSEDLDGLFDQLREVSRQELSRRSREAMRLYEKVAQLNPLDKAEFVASYGWRQFV